MKNRSNSRQASFQSLEQRRLLVGDCFAVDCVDSIAVEVRDTFRPDTPFLLQVKLLEGDGTVNRNVWDSTAQLSVDHPDVELSANTVELVNGVGSVMLQTDANVQDFRVSVSVGRHEVQRNVENLFRDVQTNVAGTIEADTTWNGVVRLTDDVTVAEGVTLTIEPGTLVLVEGVETTVAPPSIGSHIIVNGTLEANGTSERPITITASDANQPWGELFADGGDVNLKHTIITYAGNAPRGGHTMTGPAVRVDNNGKFSMVDGAISDIYGKTMQAGRGDVNFERSLLTRSVMGPETVLTGVTMSDTWIVDMDGRFRYNRIVDDNDGIYLHQAGGRSIHLQRVTVANVRDDGVDTWNAKAHFEDMIVRDIVDKGFSISTGQVAIEHSLIANVRIGVETKIDTNESPQTTINRTTIANAGFGVRAKGNSSEIQNLVTNSVIDVEADGDAIWVDGDDNRTVVRHSLIGEEWMFGEQNRVGAANFVSVTDNDFRLQVGSLAVNAGDPNAVPDEDGSTLDAGYYSLLHSLRGHRFQAVDIDRTCAAILANEQKAQVDFNSDGVVDLLDHHYLINQVMRITAGDANVDGVFDSKDLVLVFQPGEYEDETDGNSQWSEGDWNCDGDFDTKDLVAAFQAGGFQRASHPSRLTTPAGAIDQLFGQSDDNDSKVRARQK